MRRALRKRLESLRQRRKSAFTLFEILVVLIILGILAYIGISKVMGSGEGAQLASMRSDARNAISAEEAYYAANRQFAQATADASNSNTAVSTTLPNSSITVVASPHNKVEVTTKTCSDGTDGYTVTVTSTKTNKEITYDSCTDAGIQESTANNS